MAKIKENSFIYADPQKCLGCKNCELACALAHAGCDLQTAVAGKRQLQPRNSVVKAGDMFMPIQCRQCEDAPCAQACPTGAIRQEDGLVKINEQNCVGCKVCSMVCPFGAIVVTPVPNAEPNRKTKRGKALKCDLCFSSVRKDGQLTCACVEACPTQAVMLVDPEGYRTKILEARAKELAKAHSVTKQKRA